MLIFVVDIDDTVAATRERVDKITKKYKLSSEGLWTEEHIEAFVDAEAIKNDPVVPGAEILGDLARICKSKIIFLTGRSAIAREPTRLWLKNNLKIFDSVPIIMRDPGDLRHPTECKYLLFQEAVLRLYPRASFVFFDDDERLLPRYAQHGLALKAPECWQIIKFMKNE